ncbi:ligase-associated DNA damage response endonuclease PdeM [Pseudorhodobacter sp. E13]|uniref:ligase-associated DNA damage response endonuclease PdeM n=1 Tax=Pseudorhodobacter sp. E13 TaxID=2487931 RepID=UPI000F8E3B29|nr:ligase-associated DNA damage response endonuclease PdeM [Pseudorhodobacter sp. E13]RUS63220.1 ligase-associated DNA damage response endonuclease PdeM [Pseudorhodobacter sp. E13]
MTSFAFSLADQPLRALPSGALYWPEQNLLCVADLHLGKSARLARRGGSLLPPYEVAETLTRLDADIAATAPKTVVCLGDSFDDMHSAAALDASHRQWLLRLMAGRDWIWIAGNHDPAPLDLGGSDRAELRLGPLCFRHIAEPGAAGEISGHYHPKARLASRARPCFVLGRNRLILPAYGTYTGGLWCNDPTIATLIDAPALAILTGAKAIAFPLTGATA